MEAVEHTVCAVVVTYRPDPSALAELVSAVTPQVDAIVVVANDPVPGGVQPPATVLEQPDNIGLAAAQNLGIDWARDHGQSHVLLLDQDSVPVPDMVSRLLAALVELSPQRPAAVGPVFEDPREDRPAPFVRVGFPMSTLLHVAPADAPVAVDFLISSGSLIPLAVLDDVGQMDAGLFIDNVDLEWSFRVRARGYGLFGVPAARMRHRLGDNRVPMPGGRSQVVHGPVRLYFIMRNRVTLYRLRHTPKVWIAQDVPRVVAKFLIFSVLVGPRRRNVRYMLRGLADGVRGRLGGCSIGETHE